MPKAMKYISIMKLLSITPLFLYAGFCVASNHPLQDIRDTALNFARSTIISSTVDFAVSVKELDTRLKLALCDSPLTAAFPHGDSGSNTTVSVRCNGNKPWMIYVPVNIQIFQDIAVATKPLAQNTILTAEDFKLEKMDINRVSSGIIDDPAYLIGKQLTRPIRIGKPILTNMVKKPIVVHRGDRVRLLAKSDVFEVIMEGEALTDAATGDRIRATNLRSRRTIEGRLAKDGVTVFVN